VEAGAAVTGAGFESQASAALKSLGFVETSADDGSVAGVVPGMFAWWRGRPSVFAVVRDVDDRAEVEVTYQTGEIDEYVHIDAQGADPEAALRAALDRVADVLRDRAEMSLRAERELRALTRGAE
jgi:hypothetical protein